MKHYLINSRKFGFFEPEEYKLPIRKPQSYWFDLSYLTVIEFLGAAAADFLQGQLTCDVRQVSESMMIQGAQCDLKGRVLSLLDVLSWQGYKLILPSDLAPSTLKSLLMAAKLSRLELRINTQLKLYGFYSPETEQTASALYTLNAEPLYCTYYLGNGFRVFIVQSSFEEEFFKSYHAHYPLLGSLAWHTLRLAHKQINIYPESRGLFLPHRLGLQETPYLSFNKGCYKGQEIIARTHYRATLKHELRLYKIKSPERLYSGQKLLDVHLKTEVGELVDFAPLGPEQYLVAVVVLKQAPLTVLFSGSEMPIVFEDAQLS